MPTRVADAYQINEFMRCKRNGSNEPTFQDALPAMTSQYTEFYLSLYYKEAQRVRDFTARAEANRKIDQQWRVRNGI